MMGWLRLIMLLECAGYRFGSVRTLGFCDCLIMRRLRWLKRLERAHSFLERVVCAHFGKMGVGNQFVSIGSVRILRGCL